VFSVCGQACERPSRHGVGFRVRQQPPAEATQIKKIKKNKKINKIK
jgi:hypothetical protein